MHDPYLSQDLNKIQQKQLDGREVLSVVEVAAGKYGNCSRTTPSP
jgi:hypothetical protein